MRFVRIAASASLIGVLLVSAAPPSSAAGGSFTPGDVVVYEVQVQATSSSSGPVSLVDYSPTTGTPNGFAVSLPTADSGSTHALTESGSALNDGELTLAADGYSLVATGYDAAVNTASITSGTAPRTVAIVSSTGVVDTSTSLSDSTSEGNNFRSATAAVTPSSGGNIYVGSGSGAGLTTDGAITASYLNADNVHEVQVVGGNLYDSTTTAINEVGTGLPTTTATDTAVVTSPPAPAKFDPDEFAFVTLGTGPGPDTLYVADGAGGSKTGGINAVEKYSLESGVWTATGSVTVDQVVGLTASVSGGVAHIYVTGATSTSASTNTVLSSITDSSGFGGTLTGSASVLATAPTGTAFKGVAFAPTAQPGTSVPETPWAILLPAGAALVLCGGFVLSRRRGGAYPGHHPLIPLH